MIGDAELDTHLHSCFALLLYPPHAPSSVPAWYICQAAKEFEIAMREFLESILGGYMSKCTVIVKGIPSYSSCDSNNPCSASGYPAPYLGSSLLSHPLVKTILGVLLEALPYIPYLRTSEASIVIAVAAF